MKQEKQEIIQKLKQQFDWPLDGLRYGYKFPSRFFDGFQYSWMPSSEIQARMKLSLEKIRQSRVVSSVLSRLPWVQAILITGSVASMNAQITDDIDFWLVVNPRRIWITRAIDWLLFSMLGRRRLAKHGVDAHKVADRFCFNFYSNIVHGELKQHNLSYAMQFVDSIPLWFRSNAVYQQLLAQNEWISQYFPEWYEKNRVFEADAPLVITQVPVFSFLLDIVEYVAGILMLAKATKKLQLKPSLVFVDEFTTWGTERILSDYDEEIVTKRS